MSSMRGLLVIVGVTCTLFGVMIGAALAPFIGGACG